MKPCSILLQHEKSSGQRVLAWIKMYRPCRGSDSILWWRLFLCSLILISRNELTLCWGRRESHLIPGLAATTRIIAPAIDTQRSIWVSILKKKGCKGEAETGNTNALTRPPRGGIARVNNSGGKFENNVQWLLFNYINFLFNITNREWSSFFKARASWKFQLKLKGKIDFALGSIRYFLWLVRPEGRNWAPIEFCWPKEGWNRLPAIPGFWVLISGYTVILETFLTSGRVQPQPDK